MRDVFVGRQPIYDRQVEVFAYELLFRNSEVNRAGVVDGDRATLEVVLNTFMELGLEALVGQKPAFINLTRDFLLQNYSTVFPVERVVIEVLEDIEVDAEILEAVHSLSSKGYRIALDDFVYHDRLRPLVELADIVKVDVLGLDRPALREHVALLRPFDISLLAEKVETRADFEYCKALGFDYFQGYFLCKPDVVRGQRSPSNRLNTVHLLARLQDARTTFEELEGIISRDVALSYKLLRIINSAFYSLPRKVNSIRQALLLLGTTFITTWVSMIILAGIEEKPHELMVTAMVRAKMCELLARALGRDNKAAFFTVGLFSALDALLDSPLAEVLASLPLSDDAVRALLHHAGEMGAALDCVLAYEQGLWRRVICANLRHAVIRDAYLEALAWATQAMEALHGTRPPT